MLKEQGYTVTYLHAVSKEDFTSFFEMTPDEEVIENKWLVTGIVYQDAANKKIQLYVNAQENIDRLDNEAKLLQTLENNFPESDAIGTLTLYCKEKYGSSFKLHTIIGMLGKRAVDENTWFFKIEYTYLGFDGVCEAKVSGPSSNPTVYDFIIY